MNVITGTARGSKLKLPIGISRPTSRFVKEALFNIIQFEIYESKVLDLFAGSGQIGIEALSRGADLVVFVESNLKAKDVISQNLLHTHFLEKAEIKCTTVEDYIIKTKYIFDIVFLDPPYNKKIINNLMPKITKITASEGIIICESSIEEMFYSEFNNFKLIKKYCYGKKQLSLYRQI